MSEDQPVKPKFDPRQNLRPARNTEEARARGKLGAAKRTENLQKMKTMKEVYAETLRRQYEINTPNEKGFFGVIKDVLEQRTDHKARVSMFKTIGEVLDLKKDAGDEKTLNDKDMLSQLLAPEEVNK